MRHSQPFLLARWRSLCALAIACVLPCAAVTAEAAARSSPRKAAPAPARAAAAAKPAPAARVAAARPAAPSARKTAVLLATPARVVAPARVVVAKADKAAARRASRSAVLVTLRSDPARLPARRMTALVVPAAPAMPVVPSRPSFGKVYGLHDTSDALDLKSSVALVLDQDTKEVLFSKNSEAVLPIASITKLMTALVVTEAHLPLDEVLTITEDDIDTEKGSRSRLIIGTQLSRENMLHLALMSSENRAAHALGRHYPGGLDAFVTQMNRRARELGMADTHYVEPTGLSSQNQSSARDLATLVNAAHQHRIIRELSTSQEYQVEVGSRELMFRNTNGLVRSPAWDIGLQKTGYISEAGRCLVMQAQLAGRKLIMVFLDSAGKYSRIGDAERVRRWITESGGRPAAPTVQSLPKLVS